MWPSNRREMRFLLPTLAFLARHLLFVLFAMAAGCILWTILYVVLLSIAVISNQGVGGPLAFPAGIATIVIACASIGWCIFAPAAAAGALFRGLLGFPRIAAIPVVFVAAFVLSYLLYWAFIERLTTHPMPSVWTVLKNFGIYLSLPLGAYLVADRGSGRAFRLVSEMGWPTPPEPDKSRTRSPSRRLSGSGFFTPFRKRGRDRRPCGGFRRIPRRGRSLRRCPSRHGR